MNKTDIRNSQIGVMGDHAHVEGGIHFHSVSVKPPPPNGRWDYSNRIALPPHYIPRPEVLAAVRVALLNTGKSLVRTSDIQQPPEALHGMGGIGKTVLARALCDDPKVQSAFPDGILWATLGQEMTETALRSKLRRWIEDALGGIVSETAPTLDRLKAILAQLLAERACLLIVDDVWRRTHAEAFQVGGSQCRLLLTTRDAEIARGMGAHLHPVDVMAREQAVALLEQWARGKLDDAGNDVQEKIVKRVGYLPLAVKLAGEQLRRHDPEDWLAHFDAHRLRSARPESIHDDLFLTFDLSLDDLNVQDRRCYLALAIFPEDESIPQVALNKLWGSLAGLDEYAARDLMHDLAARALVQLAETPSGLAVTLHGLLREFIAAESGEQGIRETHRLLLDAYRATKEGEGWHTASDDGYLYDHLAYHLDALADHDSEAANKLHALFADEAWLHARVPTDDYRYDSYLADLSRAWHHAQRQTQEEIDAEKLPLTVTKSVHYALIQTTVNALVTNYVPALVARAVEIGSWSPARGLSVFQRVVDSKKQAQLAAKLLNTGRLTSTQSNMVQSLGVAAARAIKVEEQRIQTLIKLVPYLNDDSLLKVLAVTVRVESELERARILAVLVCHLEGKIKEHTLARALSIARKIQDEGNRMMIFAALAPHLDRKLQQQVIEEIITTANIAGWGNDPTTERGGYNPWLEEEKAQIIQDEGQRAEALSMVIPHLKDEQGKEKLIDQVMSSAHLIRSGWSLKRLLTILSPVSGNEYLVKALLAAHEIQSDRARAEALAAIVPYLDDEIRKETIEEGLATARAIQYPRVRACALATQIPQLQGSKRREVSIEGLSAVHEIRYHEDEGQALAALAPHLDEQLLADELATTHAIKDQENRVESIVAFLPYLSDKIRKRIVRQMLINIRTVADEYPLVEALSMLVPYLEDDLLGGGLDIVRMIQDDEKQAEILVALSPNLEDKWLKEALIIVRSFKYGWNQVKPLTALAPCLNSEWLAEAVDIAQAIAMEKYRARALTVLARHMEGQDRREIITKALVAAREIEHDEDRAKVITEVALSFGSKVRGSSTLNRGRLKLPPCRSAPNANMQEPPHLYAQRRIKKGEVNHFLGDHGSLWWYQVRQELLKEGLSAAYAVKIKWYRVKVLAQLIPHLSGETRMQAITNALESARTVDTRDFKPKALAALAPHLSGKMRKRALKEGVGALHKIRSEKYRAEAVADLSAQLGGNLLTETLSIACAIENEKYRAEALMALVPQLGTNHLAKILIAGSQLKDRHLRNQVLEAIIPYLKGETLSTGIEIIQDIEEEYLWAKLLMTRASYFNRELLDEVLTTTYTIKNKRYRIEALSALVPYLNDETRRQVLLEALTTAHAIEDIGQRIRFLVTLLPHLEGELLNDGRVALLPYIWHFRYHERKDMLDLLSHNDAAFLRAFDLPPEAYNQIAQSIIDICTKWEWL